VCTKGKTCSRRDSGDVLKGIKKAIGKRGLEDFYKVKKSGCFGLCKFGPIISVDDVCYGIVEKSDYKKIVKQHLKKTKPVKRLLITKKK
jgi:NADP-reducing hydrogenase subunit HndC